MTVACRRSDADTDHGENEIGKRICVCGMGPGAEGYTFIESWLGRESDRRPKT